MQTCIFCMSAFDIFIIVEWDFIRFWQRLFFIIAVFDIRLQDIIIFMSAADILVEAIEEWFIEADVCAFAGTAGAKAIRSEANRIFVGFMVHQRVRGQTGVPLEQPGSALVPRVLRTSARDSDRVSDNQAWRRLQERHNFGVDDVHQRIRPAPLAYLGFCDGSRGSCSKRYPLRAGA